MRATFKGIFIATSLSLGLGGLVGPVAADDRPVVVELFTSQGCSSCPPADEILTELAGYEDVIALALHVDYWDYIGWKDIFGDPRNTRRQQGYAQAAEATTIYTPQFIVGGRDHIVGAKSMALMDLVRDHMATPHTVHLEATRSGGHIVIEAEAMAGQTQRVDVHLVSILPQETVDVRRGENAGKRLTYSNVVSNWQELDQWDGRGTFNVRARQDGSGPAVVILQAPNHGPILAAVRLD